MAATKDNSEPLTMTFLGCGTMGVAVLGGILASLGETNKAESSSDVPSRLPSRFIACVKRPESAQRVKKALNDHPAVEVAVSDNVTAVERAEIILLGCKPFMVDEVLKEDGMREALKGKLLISILAGVTAQQTEKVIYGTTGDWDPMAEGRCRIVRAMPSTAALIRESMTVIETSTPPMPKEITSLLTWIFKRVGDVVFLPPRMMDASTALCGSGPAFFLLMIEAAADGAVAMGIPRAEAIKMAAQTMKGASSLVLSGEHPAVLKDKVCTPGGCTIGGLLVLEEGGVRGTVSRAVREATCVASQLGQGVQGVNGTRFNTQPPH